MPVQSLQNGVKSHRWFGDQKFYEFGRKDASRMLAAEFGEFAVLPLC
jgi:hypothetical protein